MTDKVTVRLRGHGLECITLQVTIRNPSFKDIYRQGQLSASTYVTRELSEVTMRLIRTAWRENAPIRTLVLTARALMEGDGVGEQLDLSATDTTPR